MAKITRLCSNLPGPIRFGEIHGPFGLFVLRVTEDPEVHVYNCTSYKIRRIINRELVAMGLRANEKMPLDGIIWYPRTILTSSQFLHWVLTLLVHLLPALLIDGVLKLTGGQPM